MKKKLIIFGSLLILFLILFYPLIKINTAAVQIRDAQVQNNISKKQQSVLGFKVPINITYQEMEQLFSENKVTGAYTIEGNSMLYLITEDKLFSVNPEKSVVEEITTQSNIPYIKTAKSFIDNTINIFTTLAIYIGIFMLIGWIVNRYVTGGVNKSIGDTYIPNITFDDVAGNKEAKENLMEIIDTIKNSEKYTKFGVTPPRGTLLSGPPGNGKTLLAKALAGTAKMHFFSVSGSEFIQMYAGLGASRVRKLFETARKHAPAIIFIDEIDAIGSSRNGGGDGAAREHNQTLDQLLTEMDGFKDSDRVMVIAATNRPDDLDEALKRPKRFDRHLIINSPDYQDRVEALKLHFKEKPVSEKVDFVHIAKLTTQMSGAQLWNISNEAGFFAVRNGHDLIEPEDIDQAINKIVAGEDKKNGNSNLKEKVIVAYHEAGHAILAKLVAKKSVPKITIVPTTMGFGGYTRIHSNEEMMLMSKTALEEDLMVTMGGRAAESIIYGENEVTTGSANDIKEATKVATYMVCAYGMGTTGLANIHELLKLLPNASFSNRIEDEIERIIQEAYKTAKQELSNNKDLLLALANKLMDVETINEEQFEEVIRSVGSKQAV